MIPHLRFENVTCVRGGRTLFERQSFELPPGEAMHVVGPNGSGKTSLLRLAAGLLKPADGRVVARERGLADERLALDPDRTLREALAFWARVDGAEERLDDRMAALGLDTLADVPVAFLSTGQRRRAGIARLDTSGASLWLVDEPFDGLDAASRDAVATLFERQIAMGGAILAASHQAMPGEWRTLELGA